MKKIIACYKFLLGAAALLATAYPQSIDSLGAVNWLKARNIVLNHPKAPDGYQELRDCDSNVVYKKITGDTIIYYYTQAYSAVPVGYLEFIEKKPYFNVTVYPKSVQPDGTIIMTETAFHCFLFRNDSLYVMNKAGSELYYSYHAMVADREVSIKKQMEDSNWDYLQAMLYNRLQNEDAESIKNLRGIEGIFSGSHPASFQLIYYKDMFRDQAVRVLEKRPVTYTADTTTALTVTMEKKLTLAGMDCYLLSIEDKDTYSNLDVSGELLLSADGRLLDLENCRLNKKQLLALLQSVKDSAAQKRVDSLFTEMNLANAPGANRSNSGFSVPYAQVEILHRKGIIDNRGHVIIPLKYDHIRVLGRRLAGVFADKKLRFADAAGGMVSSIAYDDCSGYFRGLATVTINNKIGFVDTNANQVVPCIYDQAETTYDGWLVKLHGKQGLLDTTGKELIPIKYDYIFYSSYTRSYLVRLGGKTGLLSLDGTVVLPVLYDGLKEFSDGVAMATQNGKIGFIDSSGRAIIPFMYDNAESFDGGLAKVFLVDKYGYIDKQNKIIIPFAFDEISEFDNEGFAVGAKNGLYGMIDRTGRVVIPFIYGSSFRFKGPFAVVEVDGWLGVINKKGKQIVPNRYNKIEVGNTGDWIRVEWAEKFGFYNTRGEMIVPVRYTNRTGRYTVHNGFAEGLIALEANGKWGYFDHKGKQVIPMKFDEADDFKQGMARVSLNGKYGYINRAGKELISARYDEIINFSDGWAAASLNGKWGFIDKNGKQVIPFEYDEVRDFYAGLCAAKIHGKYGYIDKHGNKVIPFIYDEAGYFHSENDGY